MRHRKSGRKLGRNASHRHAMFRNMAASLLRTLRSDEGDPERPKVAGRIITTVHKAKELRPYIEKLVTLAKKALPHEEAAAQYSNDAARFSTEWKNWRESENYVKWKETLAPAIAYRRRAFALLRCNEALDILFSDLGPRFRDRDGGYTRIVRLATPRLGDAGVRALIEFVGERDREKRRRPAPLVVAPERREEPAREEAVNA